MDLGNVGKFIAKKRKEKNLTQEKLAEKLGGISGKTISKWETGVVAPDISLLKSLSEVLGVSIIELLNGEETSSNNSSGIMEGLKYYTNKTKRKYIKIIIKVIFVSLFFVLFLFGWNNYNQVKIYRINSKNAKYDVDGYLMYNQERNIIIIKNIDLKDKNIGTDLEEKTKNMSISVYSKNKNIFTTEKNLDSYEGISLYLLNNSYYYDEDINSKEKIMSSNIDLNSLKILIEYINEIGEKIDINIPIVAKKEFSNNKLIY